MLADPHAELAKALGVDFDATGLLGNVRSKRCVQEIHAPNQLFRGIHVPA